MINNNLLYNAKEEVIMSNEIRRDYGQAEQPRNPMGVHQPLYFVSIQAAL